jgi:hypothetical protein
MEGKKFMKNITVFIMSAFIIAMLGVSCGTAGDGVDGRPGPQGENGQDGESGDDGKPGKPGENGRPGRDGTDTSGGKIVIAHTVCEFSGQTETTADGFPKYELLYEVTVMNDESAMATFVEKHFYRAGSQPNVTSHTRFYVKTDAGYNKAMVETTLWKAELKTAAEVAFAYKPGTFTRAVACK